ncbi:HSDL2 protein, partial [Quiscalus mexicanus]|nr:HSDL2 protein [Quiscalus mexicanus]
GAVAETFRVIQGAVTEEYVRSTQGVFQFELSDRNTLWKWKLVPKQAGSCSVPVTAARAAGPLGQPWELLSLYKLKLFMAFMPGNSSIKGDMMLTLSLEKML